VVFIVIVLSYIIITTVIKFFAIRKIENTQINQIAVEMAEQNADSRNNDELCEKPNEKVSETEGQIIEKVEEKCEVDGEMKAALLKI